MLWLMLRSFELALLLSKRCGGFRPGDYLARGHGRRRVRWSSTALAFARCRSWRCIVGLLRRTQLALHWTGRPRRGCTCTTQTRHALALEHDGRDSGGWLRLGHGQEHGQRVVDLERLNLLAGCGRRPSGCHRLPSYWRRPWLAGWCRRPRMLVHGAWAASATARSGVAAARSRSGVVARRLCHRRARHLLDVPAVGAGCRMTRRTGWRHWLS